MKSSFKTILLLLFSWTVFIPVCFAQQAKNSQTAAPKVETIGENEHLPFMQTENSVAANEPSSGGLLIKTLGAMGLIVGLIFLGAWGLKKAGFGNLNANSGANAPNLAILSSVSLGSGRTISTVRFGERVLLVGSTAQSFTLLGDEPENNRASNTKPLSVAEMLADEAENSFATTFRQAETNLAGWKVTKGELN